MKPRAIMVSVDYSDLLAVTLPYNRHHFEQVCVVTSLADFDNVTKVTNGHRVTVIATDLFYADGATFNKWRALEWALDIYGRHGYICLMDADVLWPKDIDVESSQYPSGILCTPHRRMLVDTRRPIPKENDWRLLPVHQNVAEWAGYTQLFHADDPHLGDPPWHDPRWKHAGGADSYFQQKWPLAHKVRPSWEVLHLGPAGDNWCGRASHYLDGTVNSQRDARVAAVRAFRSDRVPGAAPEVRHAHELLPSDVV